MRQIKRLLPVFLVCTIAVCMAFAVACTKTFTVAFDSDGGSEVTSQTVTNGQKAEKPEDPTKANYEFDGWYNGETVYDFEASVTADVTLKAHWTRLYTVTFNTDGGNAIASKTVRDGGTVAKPADPTKANHTFAGWYNGETAYKFTETVTGDVTLKAHWTLNEYTVTFDSDGGSAVEAIKVNHGATFDLPDCEKTGYDLAGWYNGETKYEGEAVTGNLTLKAHWTLKVYNVTFDSDGGSAVEAIKVNHGSTFDLPDCEKWGYELVGWYNGETKYEGEAVTGNLALTAQWKTVLQLSDIVIDTTDVKKAYKVGEQLNTEGLKVSLVAVSENGTATNHDVDAKDAVIDSVEYNSNKEGTYTIYVSYTHDGITRHANYEVTVTSVIGGVHGIIIEKETAAYDVTAKDTAPEALDLDDIKVYYANEDGTKGDEVAAEDYIIEYYLGSEKIEAADLTTEYARVYQIWASVPYTVGTETYMMSDFVLVRVNGNNIVKMEFVSDGATTSQTQSYSDRMSGTWKFNVEYRLGDTATIDLSTAELGTGDNQYTLSNYFPATAGEGVATVTYHYAVGADIWEYSAEVPYTVTEPAEDSTYKAVIDVNVGTDDGYKTTATNVITKTLSEGDEIVPYMVYVAPGSGLGTNSENKTDTDGSNKLYGRVQFAGTRGVTLYLAGPATITLKARYGSSSGSGAKFQLKQGDTVIAESDNIANSSKYETVTIEVESAGVYDLYATGSLNTFAIEIEGTILGKVEPKVSLNANDITTLVTGSTENVTLSNDFTLLAKSGKAVDVSACDPVVIGGQTFTKKIDLKGGGAKDNRCIKFSLPKTSGKVQIVVYASHGGGAEVERTLELCKADGTAVTSAPVVGAGAVVKLEVNEITEAGDYYIRSTNGGQVIYYIGLFYELAEVA